VATTAYKSRDWHCILCKVRIRYARLMPGEVMFVPPALVSHLSSVRDTEWMQIT